MESEAFSLLDEQGRRLYLTPDERERFRDASKGHEAREVRTFCHLLLFTGCRISEALEVTPERFDWPAQTVMFRNLKKHSEKPSYRAVPLPAEFLDDLDLLHRLIGRAGSAKKERLWLWSRPTAWRRIKTVMDAAEIRGAHATAKGLRHGFGVIHALNKTPLPTLQRFMGHSDPKTTAIYMQALGEEARQLAGAAW